MDGKSGSVKVQEVNTTSSLSGVVSKGDVLVAINGERCNQGHKHAAKLLGAATGQVEVIFKSKATSTIGKLFRRSSSNTSAIPTETIVIAGQGLEDSAAPTTADETTIAVTTELHPSEHVPTGGAAIIEPTGAPVVSKAQCESPETPQDETVHVHASMLQPEEHAPPPCDALNPGEYFVVLKRQNTSSIGMRLVQKRFDDLPTIADIDKVITARCLSIDPCGWWGLTAIDFAPFATHCVQDGPASQTEIQLDDVLLLVNGVDARASHEDLKRALGSKQDAVLKLRRPDATMLRPLAIAEPAAFSESLVDVNASTTTPSVAKSSPKFSRCCGFRGDGN